MLILYYTLFGDESTVTTSMLFILLLIKSSLETVIFEVTDLENIIFSSTKTGDSKANVQNNDTVSVSPI